MKKFILIFNTVRHLKMTQIFYQTWYKIKNKIPRYNKINYPIKSSSIVWKENKLYSISLFKKKTFTFLNIKHKFLNEIDWNYDEYGKLWTYNLNYFDFLNQEEINKKIGLDLIYDYIKKDASLKEGKEPYPISLRGINWVKFLSKNEVKDEQINQILYSHYRILFKNLEYHLLGNHLLENAFSLLFGAYYFRNEKLYTKSKKILFSELNEQILNDGGHYELSPMYHKILFCRLLDCINLIKLNPTWKKDNLLFFLEKKASLMNSWLKNITYKNGETPMVNDSTYCISPTSNQLFLYAKKIGIISSRLLLSDSGYRKITNNNYELFIDVGNIGPDYQPGHAHSDTFNFELIKADNPVIVDTGISTYEKNFIRQDQRSTQSHNTVKIGSKDQTQVWGGFRVGNRAKVINLTEKSNFIEACHDGYSSENYNHTRSFSCLDKEILVYDRVNRPTINNAKAYFHLHSSIIKPSIEFNKVILETLGVSFEFFGSSNISVGEYQLSAGFNKTNLAYKIIVTFNQKLKTLISL